MGDGCCNRCCQCCAVPKVSISLSVVTVILFVAAVFYGTEISTDEPCPCDETVCCVEDEDSCTLDQCFCTELATERSFCQDKEEDDDDGIPDELERTPDVLGWLCSGSGLLLLIVSFASCCCFGFFQDDNPSYPTVQDGYPLVAVPAYTRDRYERKDPPV